jgi:hypothetical protein
MHTKINTSVTATRRERRKFKLRLIGFLEYNRSLRKITLLPKNQGLTAFLKVAAARKFCSCGQELLGGVGDPYAQTSVVQRQSGL